MERGEYPQRVQETSGDPGTQTLVPEEVIRTVAANLYLARVTALPKMSQEDLADLSGVSVNTIAKIEQLRDPEVPIHEGFQFGTVLSLGAALRLSAEKLFTPTRVKRDGRAARLRSLPSLGPPLHPKVPAVARASSQGRVWIQET